LESYGELGEVPHKILVGHPERAVAVLDDFRSVDAD
jgi:hypothetical protein